MATSNPLVILINIHQKPTIFSSSQVVYLNEGLRERCRIIEATTGAECVYYLRHGFEGTCVYGVYVAVTAILDPEHHALSCKLVEWVLGGGTVVTGSLIPKFADAAKFNMWMRDVWDLPWRMYTRQRQDSTLNTGYITSARIVQALPELPETIDIYEMNLSKVRAPDMIYRYTEGPKLQTTAALKKYGLGYFGYVGYLCDNAHRTNVSLAMFGLLTPGGDVEQTNAAASMSVCKTCKKGNDVLEGEGRLLRRCTRCWNASYCGEQCQWADFKLHRTICRKQVLDLE